MVYYSFLRRQLRAIASRIFVDSVRGFTLIELLAVTGVLVIISSIVLANNAAFGGAITLRSLAYDIALSVREAQTYGISVRKFGSGAGEFGAGYGVHAEITSTNTYILFADVANNNGMYDIGQNESVESLSIRGGYRIVDLCATPLAGSELCSPTVASLDILFKRPEPDAYIRINGGATTYQRGRIVIEAPRGNRAAILIESTGQISVQAI